MPNVCFIQGLLTLFIILFTNFKYDFLKYDAKTNQLRLKQKKILNCWNMALSLSKEAARTISNPFKIAVAQC